MRYFILIISLSVVGIPSMITAKPLPDTLYYSNELRKVDVQAEWMFYRLANQAHNDTFYFYYPTHEIAVKQVAKWRRFKGMQLRYYQSGGAARIGEVKHFKPVGYQRYFSMDSSWMRTDYFNCFNQIKAVFYLGENEDTLITETKDLALFAGTKSVEDTYTALSNYVAKMYVRPDFLDDFIDVYITVHFYVSTEGSVKDVEVIRELDPRVDVEIVKIIEGMPKWKPAYFKGRHWTSEFTLSIHL
jgi:hypothetical protein